MAEYSWVDFFFRSVDPEIVEEADRMFSQPDQTDTDGEWTCLSGETSYGTTEELEEFLTEKGVEWHRFSDGKYDYDGDEGHWSPEEPGKQYVFTRLNNGGRVFTHMDLSAIEEKSDAEIGAAVRAHFAYAKEFKGLKTWPT